MISYEISMTSYDVNELMLLLPITQLRRRLTGYDKIHTTVEGDLNVASDFMRLYIKKQSNRYNGT